MMQQVDVIVTCNYCHTAPAAGWLLVTDPETNGPASRAACQLCADKEGNPEMLKEVLRHD